MDLLAGGIRQKQARDYLTHALSFYPSALCTSSAAEESTLCRQVGLVIVYTQHMTFLYSLHPPVRSDTHPFKQEVFTFA